MRSLRCNFSLRLGKGSGLGRPDQATGAYQSTLCPNCSGVSSGRGAAGVGRGDGCLPGARSREDVSLPAESPELITVPPLFRGVWEGGTCLECGIWERVAGGSEGAAGAFGDADALAGEDAGEERSPSLTRSARDADPDRIGDFCAIQRFMCSMTRAQAPFGGLEAGGFISSSSTSRALAWRRPSGVVSYLPARRSRERETMVS